MTLLLIPLIFIAMAVYFSVANDTTILRAAMDVVIVPVIGLGILAIAAGVIYIAFSIYSVVLG